MMMLKEEAINNFRSILIENLNNKL